VLVLGAGSVGAGMEVPIRAAGVVMSSHADR
jgi:hypothetical protein